MTTCDFAFRPETLILIEAIENESRRVRKSRINPSQMEELVQFVSRIAVKYEQISDDINMKLEKKSKGKKRKGRKRFEITKKDYYVVDRIIDTNKLNMNPKIVRKDGKTSKRYDFYQIRKIARIFYVALNRSNSLARRLLEVPDVHFAVSTIRNDEFGDLKRFLEYKV